MAQCGIIYEVPFRFYFNNTATGDFVNEGKGNQDYNVKWHKNDGIVFKLFLDDGTIPVEIYSGEDNFFNLSSK